MADSLCFFSWHFGFTLGKWLLSFAQDSSTLSSVLTCFGAQNTNKNTKTYTKWLKLLSRVLNMPIELKGLNYYSKVFKRINYKLSNSTFWVVISSFLVEWQSLHSLAWEEEGETEPRMLASYGQLNLNALLQLPASHPWLNSTLFYSSCKALKTEHSMKHLNF